MDRAGSEEKMEKINKKKKVHLGFVNISLLVILTVYSLFLGLLLLWGAVTSIKTLDEFYRNTLWIPSGNITEWGWDNYIYVFENFAVRVKDTNGRILKVDILGQTFNTLLYAVLGSLVTTFCCCLVAYLTAKFHYFLSKVIYTLVLVVMVIPIVGNTPSILLFLKETRLYDTWIGTYIMKFTFLGLYFLVFNGVYEGISSEYSEAATIDGANEYQIFFKLMLPLVKPTFNTVFLIHFIGYWNDYTMALMYMPSHPTLAYGVYYLSVSNEPGMSYAPMRMVACVILALPITIMFVVFREKLLGNTTAGGVKE